MVRPDRRSLIAAGLVIAAPSAALAAGEPLKASLAPLARFLGRWTGEGQGEPGVSVVQRTYEPVLGGQFVMMRGTSTYAPQPGNPKGELHEELGLFSFDAARKRAVFRQFHKESFAVQYLATAADLSGEMVFETEAMENIPAGWRARETYRFSGPDAFEEVFELAPAGKDYGVYSHNRLKRAA